MEVICIDEPAFFALLERAVKHIDKKNNTTEDKWISGEEAMAKLRITSKSTLQKLRDEGKIRFSQPERKMILYDVDSIYAYLEKNVRETF